MLKSHKRFIWFFGYWIVGLLDSYMYFLIEGHSIWSTLSSYEILIGMVFSFAIWLLPLFYFKDDKVKR